MLRRALPRTRAQDWKTCVIAVDASRIWKEIVLEAGVGVAPGTRTPTLRIERPAPPHPTAFSLELIDLRTFQGLEEFLPLRAGVEFLSASVANPSAMRESRDGLQPRSSGGSSPLRGRTSRPIPWP